MTICRSRFRSNWSGPRRPPLAPDPAEVGERQVELRVVTERFAGLAGAGEDLLGAEPGRQQGPLPDRQWPTQAEVRLDPVGRLGKSVAVQAAEAPAVRALEH